ncbi:carnitine dehydratase [Acinetobacter sp. NCu2D-2]|uniref:CaiB/BaiF CoA transferase family protein n=1 Tax=Acinetobacter sp. NCu2D-2 TaxID=1608473 RepID=UPI0007CDA5EE|nr:CaiB/BaiF CoA-transferase family protein [Acinetobacter sp. NCu2D-2]ANF82420.1 carnitine dehydratase [Acinetobacter sp. NCu2D-2]
MNFALDGLKVLDFSTLLPGPFASMYLADMGATVVHIESPNRPDLLRLMPPFNYGQAVSHNYLNRNKQSVALDLKDPKNINLIKSKISDYDIVIEQFRPGVMQRLGLDYAELSEINPRLIYCSITGYGQTGPYKDKAGHDINYLALSGIAGHSGRVGERPPALGIQIADIAGGSMHAMVAILAAVIERHKSGRGQYIDISITDCAVPLNNMAAAASLAAKQQARPESSHLNGGTFYDYYETLDQRYLAIGSLEPQFLSGLAQILDLPILIEKGLTYQLKDQAIVKQAIQDKIKTKSLQDWQDIFQHHDVCVEPVLRLEEALHSELAQERDWTVQVPRRENSSEFEQQLACPIKFSRSKIRYEFIGQNLGESDDW